MIIEAKIFQMIKWKDRKRYFFGIDWQDDGEYDLLHCTEYPKRSWKPFESLIGLFASVINRTYGKNVKPDAFAFNAHNGFPMWVKRPHEFKLNDIVEIEINVRSATIKTD